MLCVWLFVSCDSLRFFGVWVDLRPDARLIFESRGHVRPPTTHYPWSYPTIGCFASSFYTKLSGPDGTKHVLKILNNAKFFLKKKGFLIIPVISLSNEKKIISKIKNKFKNYKKIQSQSWILPTSMANKIIMLERLKKRGSIFFEKKLGIITFKTDIYLMVNK